MVDNVNQQAGTSLVGLTAEAMKNLDDIKQGLDKVTGDLDALDKIGIDTTKLRSYVDWGNKAHTVLTERFAPKT
jgi:hypothetical protein